MLAVPLRTGGDRAVLGVLQTHHTRSLWVQHGHAEDLHVRGKLHAQHAKLCLTERVAQALRALGGDSDFIAKQFIKTRRFVKLYRDGLAGPDAQAAETKRSHEARVEAARRSSAQKKQASASASAVAATFAQMLVAKGTHRVISERMDAALEALPVSSCAASALSVPYASARVRRTR